MINYVRGGDGTLSGVVLLNGIPTVFTVGRKHPSYNAVFSAIQNSDAQALVDSIDYVEVLRKDGVEIVDGVVYFNGQELHNTLSDRMLSMANDGLSIEPMKRFLENLMQNPSSNSVNELYDFLENKNLPITEDGCFLAYKCVGQDYLDKYSHTFSNQVGSVLKMTRNQVDDDRTRECSYGFHVGGLEYSGPNGSYYCTGDRVMIVKVNPKNAVSVPRDYSAQKLRVSEYEVVAEYEVPLSGSLYGSDGVDLTPTQPEYGDSLADLLVDDVISFTYTKSNGDVSQRSGVVLELDDEEELLKLEQADLNIRSFHYDGITNLKIDEVVW